MVPTVLLSPIFMAMIKVDSITPMAAGATVEMVVPWRCPLTLTHLTPIKSLTIYKVIVFTNFNFR